MESKILVYLGLAIALLLFVGTFAMGNMNGRTVSNVGDSENMANHHGGEQSIILNDEDLAKYRSEDIPSDCRLPDYNDDVKKWAEHLSHHQETQFCLEYYNEESTTETSESSSDIPEKCRLPSGRDKESWKEHLGHHQETKECLKYF